MFSLKNADPLILEQLRALSPGEYYRLVDPDSNRVFDYHGGVLTEAGRLCYATWDRSSACCNCISQRALADRSPTLKLDMTKGEILLACALPVTLCQRRLALEVIWNVTHSLTAENAISGKNDLIADLVDRFNTAAVQDAYTGLYNKCFTEQALEKAVAEWTPDKPLIVVMLDIDRFKEINDTFGHTQGDEVILALAALMADCAAAYGGRACRVGGDEFLLLFQGLPRSLVDEALQHLKRDFAARRFGMRRTFHACISAGVGEYSPGMGDWRRLLDHADQLMYGEKSRKSQP